MRKLSGENFGEGIPSLFFVAGLLKHPSSEMGGRSEALAAV